MNLIQHEIDEILGISRSKKNLAETAIMVEREIIGDPVGLQDQYHAAFGGFSKYTFQKDDVDIQECDWTSSDYDQLNTHELLISTGKTRDARNVLEQQKLENSDLSKDKYFHEMVALVDNGYSLLRNGEDINRQKDFGMLINESWLRKKELAGAISNSTIDEIISIGLEYGAWGAKLLGAGNGGFVFFMGQPIVLEDIKLKLKGLNSVDIKFQSYGSTSQPIL